MFHGIEGVTSIIAIEDVAHYCRMHFITPSHVPDGSIEMYCEMKAMGANCR